MYQVKALSQARARIRANLEIDWKAGDTNQVDDNVIEHIRAHPSVFQIVSSPGSSLAAAQTNPITGDIEFSDEISAAIKALVFANIYPVPSVSSPAAGATGISKTPTIDTKEGVASESTLLLYGVSQTVGANTTFLFGSASSSDIPYNAATGALTLEAGIEYELTAAIYGTSFTNSTGGYGLYAWVDSSTKTKMPTGAGAGAVPSTFASNVSLQSTAKAVFRPAVTTDVELRCYEANGTFSAVPDRSWATARETVQQYYNYTADRTQVQIKRNSDDVVVYQSALTTGLSVTASPALSASTAHSVRVRHSDVRTGNLTAWSEWVSFTTGV